VNTVITAFIIKLKLHFQKNVIFCLKKERICKFCLQIERIKIP